MRPMLNAILWAALAVTFIAIALGIFFSIARRSCTQKGPTRPRPILKRGEVAELIDNYIETLPTMNNEGREIYRKNYKEIYEFISRFLFEKFCILSSTSLPTDTELVEGVRAHLEHAGLRDIDLECCADSPTTRILPRIPLKFLNDYCGMVTLIALKVNVDLVGLNSLGLDNVRVFVLDAGKLSDLPLLDGFTNLTVLYLGYNNIKRFALKAYLCGNRFISMPSVRVISAAMSKVDLNEITLDRTVFSRVFPNCKGITAFTGREIVEQFQDMPAPRGTEDDGVHMEAKHI